MNFTPKILDTHTKEGDVSVARRKYLIDQIHVLEEQKKKYMKEDEKINPYSQLMEKIAITSIIETLKRFIRLYSLERYNLRDREEAYND